MGIVRSTPFQMRAAPERKPANELRAGIK